jgi:hypothetical protein
MWPLKCPVLACGSIFGNQCCFQTCTLNSSRGACLKMVDCLFLGYFFIACHLFPMTWSQRSLMTQNCPWVSAGFVINIDPICTMGECLFLWSYLICKCTSHRDLPLTPEALFLSHYIPYSPSDPSIYAPPYPILPCDPIISIICHSCHVHLDHYHVIFTAGHVQVNSLVQGENWDGPLLILHWVAVNSLEIVGEMWEKGFWRAPNSSFLVFMHFWVRRPEDMVLIEGVWRLWHYPDAPDSQVFLARACPVEELPLPGPLFTPTLSISPVLPLPLLLMVFGLPSA